MVVCLTNKKEEKHKAIVGDESAFVAVVSFCVTTTATASQFWLVGDVECWFGYKLIQNISGLQ